MTNNSNTLPLLAWSGERANVCHYSGALTTAMLHRLKPQFVVSFNYVHLIKEDILQLLAGRWLAWDMTITEFKEKFVRGKPEI